MTEKLELAIGNVRARIVRRGAQPVAGRSWAVGCCSAKARNLAKNLPGSVRIFGQSTSGMVRIDGTQHAMLAQGFAATQPFDIIEIANRHARFCLRENELALRQYPFRFLLKVAYRPDRQRVLEIKRA